MEEQNNSLKKVLEEDKSAAKNNKTNAYAVTSWGWFNFLIYFALWAGALLNIANGIRQLTGAVYLSEGLEPEMVYEVFPNLKSVDVLFGVLACVFGVFQIVTRFSLAHYKKYAPIMLHLSYIFIIIVDITSAIVVTSIIGVETFSTIIAKVIVSIIILLINIKYFNNRKHVFIN